MNIEDLLSMSPDAIKAFIDDEPTTTSTVLAREASAWAQHAAWLEGYFTARSFGTPHDGALADADKYTKRVRKAMGYSYP